MFKPCPTLTLFRQFLRVPVTACLLATISMWSTQVKGATYTWNQSAAGTFNFNQSGNWTTAGFPNGIGDVVNLSNALGGAQTINLNQVITLGALNIGDTTTTNAFTLAGGTTGLLNFDVSSGTASITKALGANANDIISAPILFRDDLVVNNNSATGTLTISGTMRGGASSLTLGGTGTAATGSIDVSGIISNSGNLIKADAGTARLSAANTYAGSTQVNAGTLILNNATALPIRSPITIASSGTLDAQQAATFGSLSGAGLLTNTTATARLLTIGRDDTSTTFAGRIAPTTAANIQITKIGAGTLTLQPQGGVAAGTWTGATIVNGGTLALDTSASSLTSAFISNPTLQLAGGNFQIIGRNGASVTQSVGNFTVGATGGSITVSPNGGTSTILRLGTFTSTAAGGALLVTAPSGTTVSTTTTFTNNILGGGRAVFSDGTANTYNWLSYGSTTPFTMTGLGTAVGTTPSYTGTLPNNGTGVATGNYTVSGSQAQGSAASTINTLKLTSTAAGQSLDLSTFNLSSAGILVTGSDGYSINGTGVLNATENIIHQYNSGGLTVNAGIGGTTFTKAGTGALTIAGSASYTGLTYLDGGTLSFSNTGVSGAGTLGLGVAQAVQIRDGATLQYTGPTGTIAASTTANSHTFLLPGGQAVFDVSTGGSILSINGVISGGGGLTKTGLGTLQYSGANTYTGPTIINGGTLLGSGVNFIADTSPVIIGAAGTLDINGTAATQTETIGSISGTGAILNSNSNTKTLAVGNDNTNTTFSGTFSGTGGNSFTKQGTGILTLSGTMNWTGGKSVNGGVLRFGVDNALNSTGTLTIANSGSVSVVDLNGFNFSSAAITFGGTSSTATAQGNILIGTGTLTLGGDITYDGTNPVPGLGAVISASGAGGIVLSGSRTLAVGNSANVGPSDYELTLATPISGTGFGLTKSNLGNLLISGAISATGAFVMNAGGLTLDYTTDNNSKLPSGALSLLGGNVTLNGNASANTAQAAASTTFAAGGNPVVTLNPGSGQQIALSLGALTRAASAGTVRFILPSGSQTATNGVLTTATNDATTGLVGTGGAWLTVTSGGVTNFGTVSGGNIIPVTPTVQDTVTNWLPGQNITDSSGFSGTLDTETTINTLRFNSSSASAISITPGGVLRLESGGILQTAATTGTTSISGGRLVPNVGSELIFTTLSGSSTLAVGSGITGATAITKTGDGVLRLSSFNSATGTVSPQNGTLEITGGFALGDTAAVTFPGVGGNTTTLSLLAGQTETIGSLSGGSTSNNTSTVLIGAGSNLTINQGAAGTYSGFVSGTGTLTKVGSTELTLAGGSAATFTGPLVINAGSVRLAGNNTGSIGSTAISVNNPGSQLHINHDNNNGPDRIPNAAVVTLNNTAPGLGLLFRDTENAASNSETIGAVTLGAGHNVIASDYTGTTAGRFGTLTIGAASGSNLLRTNNATVVVAGRSLGGVAFGAVTVPSNGGRITFTNAITGANAVVGGGGADGTATASIFPYMIGQYQSTGAAPAASDVGNSFVRLSGSGLRPLSTAAADGEYTFEAAGYNGLGDSTTNNLRFTASGTVSAASAGTKTANALAIDSTAGAVTLTGPGSDTLVLTSGALLSTGAAANNTSLTGFAGVTTATNNEYIFFVTNNQFTLGSPLTSASASLTKSGAGSMIMNGLTGNTYSAGTYFNQGIIEASALSNLGTGNLNFFGGGLRWAASTTFDISSRTVNFGVGGATLDTNGNNITLGAAIGNGGVGSLTKAGVGNLTLAASPSYLGDTIVSGGRLIVNGGANNRLAQTNLTLSGTAALQLGDATNGASDQTLISLTGAAGNSIVGGGNTVSTLTVNQNTATTYAGFLGGAGTNENNIALVKTGGGTLTLGAVASTATGGITINAGVLAGGNNANSFGAAANAITLNPTGANDAVLNPLNTVIYANPITVTSSGGGTGAAILTGGGTTGGPTMSGPIALSNKDLIITKVGTTGAFTITGGITGTGNLVIDNFGTTGVIALSTNPVNNTGSIKNAGIGATATTTISANIGSNVTNIIQDSATSALTLSGSSIAYTGATIVNQGILSVTGSAAAPLTTNALTVAGGATLNMVNTAGQTINLGSGAISLGAGSGVATLGLELGSLSAYDQFTTSGAATTANSVRFNLNGLTGFGAGTYNLLQASGGLNNASYSLGTLSGSLAGLTLNLASSSTSVDLVAAASTGDFYWKGAFGTSWTGLSGLNTNFATDPAGTQGTIDVNGTPGTGSSVIFSASGLTGTALNTTLDGQFSIKDLTFNNAVGSGPLASIALAPGVVGSSLKLTPTANGINVQAGAPAVITISAPVILGAAQSWTVTDAATVLTASGGVTGDGFVLNKAGSGILQLTGAGLSTYDGQTNINAGTLRAGSATGLSANSTHSVGAAGTLSINGFSNTIGALSGAVGAVVNNNTATAATLTAGGNNATTTYAGTIVNGSTAALGLVKTGTGALTLSGANTYTGNTTINGGTLNITGTYTGSTTASILTYGAATAANTIVNVSNNMDLFQTRGATTSGAVAVYNQTAGTVNVTPGNTSNQHYVANGAGSYGFFNLTGGTYKINGGVGSGRWSTNGTNNLATPSVGVVYIGGTGFLDHTNAEWFINGYSHGQITVASSGSIDHTGSNAPFAITMDTTVTGGSYGVLNIAGGNVTVGAQPIRFGNNTTNGSGNTGFVNLAGGTLSVGTAMNSSVNATGGNNAYINFAGGTLKTSANVTAFVPASSAGIAYTSTIFGAITNSSLSGAPDFTGGLTIDTTGANTMTLTNVLSGATGAGITQGDMTVTGGTGYVGSPEVIFSSAGLVPGGTPAAGYALTSGGAVTGIVITSPGTYTAGTTPTVTLAGGGGTGASISIAQLNTSNNVSGGLTKIGTGTLTLSGANTYTGGTTVNAGTLALGATNTLASTGAVTINGGTLDLPATFTNSVGVVTLQTGGITGAGSIASSANFELQSGTVSGVLAGTTGINKTTAGSVTISGVNTFSGPVNANGGTLSFATSANLGNASASNTLSANGGKLSYTGSGSLDLTANRVLKLNASGGTLDVPSTTGVLTVSGGIDATSTGGLTKTGPGTVVIPGTSAWTASGNNVTVSDGTLRAGFGTGGISNLTLGGTGNMEFTNGATQSLTLSGGLNLAGGSILGFELGLGDANPLISLNDQIISTAAANVAGNITLNFFNVAGFGAGSYNLISAPSGLLPGGVDYLLGTAPAGFNYTINKSATLISLDVVSFVPRYWTNSQVTGSWSTVNGGPLTNFSTDAVGAVNYGLTPQTSDTVIFSADSVAGPAVSTTLDGNYTIDGLQFRNNGNVTAVTSTTIAQGSSGTLTIKPSSTSSGIVVGANAGAAIISAPVVASNALVASQTWSVDGTGANGSSLTISGDVAFNANITKNGGGMLTLSGNNSGNGNFTLSAGTLNINSATALGGNTGTFSIAPGVTINNTLASAVVMTTNKPMTWNSFTFTGSNDLNLGSGAATLALNTTVTTTAGTLTAGGTIGDSGNNRSLTKDGDGTLAIGGNLTIGGNLAVTAGTGSFSGTTNTIGGSVTASGAGFTMTGNSAITGALAITAGTASLNGTNTIGGGVSVAGGAATMNGANTVTGSVAVTGGSLALGGANTISGGASVTTGMLTLGGANTIGTGVTVNSGTLNIANSGALGANTFTINGGTIDNTSGSALTLGTNNAQSWGGNYTFTGTNNLNAGTGNVTLAASTQITVMANTLTEGGVIDDGVSTFGITKGGAGTLVLGATNTYGGATTINEGTLKITANQTLSAATNSLIFGTAAGTTVGSLDLSTASATFGGAMVVQTNSATANTISIGSGQTLRVNGAVTVGAATGPTTTKLTVSGAGTLTIGAAGAPTNASVQLGNSATTNQSNGATWDMTGLSTFYANLGTGTFRVGDPTNANGTGTAGSTLNLAPSSTIIATTITSDSPANTVTQAIKLGTGTNVLQATTITIGGAGNRAVGTLDFLSGTGTVQIRDLAGTGRAAMNVQNGGANTGSNIAGTVDFTGHSADLLLGTVAVGGRSAQVAANGTGTFSFDTGTMDATTFNLAARTGTTATSGNVTGTLNIGGGTTTIGTLTMSTNSVALTAGSSTGDATSTVNIGGGTNTIGTVTMGINTVGAGFATGSNSNATINISGGTTTVNTAFSMGAQNSANNAATTVNTATSTLTVSGGSLTLAGTTDLKMGSTTLDVNNVATSDINITGTGVLTVGGNITTAIFAGSTVTNTITLDGGTLDMTGGNIGAAGLLITNVNLQSGTLQNLAQLNNGAALVKSSGGTLTLSGTNAYTGDTTFAASGGIIKLGSATAIPDGTGKGNLVTTNGTVDMNGFNETINGLTGTGIVDNLAASTTSTLTVGGANASSTFSGTLQNTGTGSVLALTKTGSGTLTLNSANTFSGGTSIAGGVVQVDHGSALGTGALSFVTGGVRLQVAGGQTLANAIVLGPNTAVASRGMIESTGTGTATLSGPITINANAVAGGHFANTVAGSFLNIAGAITSSVPVVQRLGNVIFSGGGTGYTAFTNGQDTTSIGANDGIATTATMTIGSSAAGSFDLAGFNQALVGIVKGASAATIGNSSTTADSTLTTTGTSSFAGTIQNTLGSGTMKTSIKIDTGALTLTAANTYTGATTINTGTLSLIGSGAVSAATPIVFTGAGNFNISGIGAVSLTVGSLAGVASSTVTLGNKTLNAGGDDTSTTFAGAASGTGGLTKQGVGTLTLTGANSYSGATTISAGTLVIGSGGTTGTLAGNSAVSNNGALIFSRSDSISQGSNFGSISGSGSVTQNGAGVLTFTASNTYSGNTTVNSGTLLANNTTGSATGTGAVSFGATGALGGTGTLSPTGSNGIAIAGLLTPGAPGVNDGVGTLGLSTVDGNVTFASTSTADFQLLTNGTHGYSVTYDSAGFIDTVTGTYVNGGNDRLLFNSTGTGGIDFSALVANSLAVTFASGYTPAFHDIFDLVDWSSLVGGLNSTQLNLPSLASYDSTWSWDTTKFASHGIVGIVAVPEPGRVLLLLLGLFGMLMRRRRH